MKTSQFIHRVQVLREERDLYSHSYLGLGILSVRRELFKGLSESEAISSPCIGRNARPFHHTFRILTTPSLEILA
ncbi:Ectonucleoside triphosphate diphosphohydrolase 5 [Caligus rogercresseyi]|uniref:Ectonucleoside triphosphate diphosphohydrolase 5 n=1 Tax=Caligus rogercresseyi TaxID=217165 RepID=A0A7T8QUT9_CALRO|nr:Ectonucleoside triphosphate diphosphohydrolase 5 [Caligus rogercresseyi]